MATGVPGERRRAAPKPPKPPKPWERTEAGRYRSADARFTLESDGAGRWFLTDVDALDELGLPRTTGPFQTLDAAKTAAADTREQPAVASPLASRLAEAASRPARVPPPRPPRGTPPGDRSGAGAGPVGAQPAEVPHREPAPPPRTWLDDLGDADRDAAVRARRLIDALVADGIDDAEALVRRDVLGGTPAVATRLLARDVLAALARLRDPSAADVAAAVAGVLAGSPKRRNMPGWALVERDGPGGQARTLRLTSDDLRQAAGED